MSHDCLPEIEHDEVAELLARLVERSLVVLDHATGRYRLLETVREYAGNRLREQGESDCWRGRHLACFTALAEEAEPNLAGGDQQAWLEQLDAEHDNVRASLRWAEGRDPEAGLRLAGAIWRFWYVRGHFSEGREYLAGLLSAVDPGRRTVARASALTGAGVLAYCQGDYPTARALFQEGLDLRREQGDRPGIATLLNNLGNVAYDQGDYASARALFEESLVLRRELGEWRGLAASLNNLGNVANEQGDYATARELFEESVALKKRIGDRWGIASSLSNLGLVAYNQEDYPAAHALFEESLTIRRELGDRGGAAISLNNLANVALARSDYAAARTLFRESLAIKRELGDRWGIAFSLEGLGAAEAGIGGALLAARLWGAAESLREEIGAPIPRNDRPRYERTVAEARAATPGGDTAFHAAWAEGCAMTMAQAIELALREGHD